MSNSEDKKKKNSGPHPQQPIPYNHINFPLYTITPLSCNHVIVGGGGGAANTGVFNGFAICEIGYQPNSSSKDNAYTTYEIQRHPTGSTAIMNMGIGVIGGKRIFLACGRDADCHVYQVRVKAKGELRKGSVDQGDGGGGLRHRNGGVRTLENSSSEDKDIPDLVFDIQSVVNAQTDFGIADPCQNTLSFTPDSRLLVTGGSDGTLRIWNFPEMQLRASINASKREISDVDISPDRKVISCISKDGKCKIWSLSEGQKLVCSMDLPPEDEGKYLYKRGRFALVEDHRDREQNVRLFTILNPINYKLHKSYIQHWTGKTSFNLTRVCPVGEALSALAVSKCGRYVAVGSMTNGDVGIYIGFSLQRIKQIDHAHKTFVTGLAFLPPPTENSEESVLADCDAAVVSISVDNRVLVHYVEKKGGVSMWIACLLVILVLLGTFVFCSWLDI